MIDAVETGLIGYHGVDGRGPTSDLGWSWGPTMIVASVDASPVLLGQHLSCNDLCDVAGRPTTTRLLDADRSSFHAD